MARRERLRGLVLDETTTASRPPVQRRQVTLGLGYTRTLTADLNLFKSIIVGATRVGHRVLVITTLRDSSTNRERVQQSLGDVLPLVRSLLFTNGMPKRQFAQQFGHKVDIWIDDIPETICAPTRHEVSDAELRYPNTETLP